MQIRILPILLLFLSTSVFSQVYKGTEASARIKGTKRLYYPLGKKLPALVELNDQSEIASDAAISWIKKSFQLNEQNQFKKTKVFKDHLGVIHTEYQLYFKSYKVEGLVLKIHEKEGKVKAITSNIVSLQDKSIVFSLSEPQALQFALNSVNAIEYRWQNEKEILHLRKITGDTTATYFPKAEKVYWVEPSTGTARISYKFDLYAIQPLGRYWVYVDAETGTVLHKENRIRSCFHSHHSDGDADEIEHIEEINATGTAATRYSGTQNISTEYIGGNYKLRDYSRGAGVETFDMNNGYSYSGAVDFTDSDNNWPAGIDAPAYDAHWGAAAVYDYYYNVHGRNSYDNAGSKLISYVHYGVDYDNAFWDGSSMNYGDGSNISGGFKPLTCLDVVGHELTHGVTEYSAGLQYQAESGALNESFSDIFGVVLEFYKKPGSANYLIGDQITIGSGALRSMSSPNTYGQPDTYQGNLWDPSQEVHTNSGVGNFWFYLLSQGGSGTNDNGDAYSITGIGITKAAAISYRMLTVYLTPTSDYASARQAAIASAIDLYGTCSPELIAATNAWYAVGVGETYSSAVNADFMAEQTQYCSVPASVSFVNMSNNAASYSWNFGDGNTSTAANPTHTYLANGTYSVTLTVGGGGCGGSDVITKTSYIVVNTSGTCPVNLPTAGAGVTQTACNGILMDDGGAENYTGLTDSYITIAPTGAMSVTLTFTSLALENTYDFVKVYDGSSTTSPLLGSYTGTTLPSAITSSGGAITVRLISDELVEYSGFSLNWSCTQPTSAPVANFVAIPAFSCTGIVSFVDKSSNAPNSWSWTFGDGYASTDENPTHTYASSGTYTVTLTSCNNIGCSTVETKTNYVTVDKASSACINKNMPTNGNANTITACSGTLYDSGGISDYSSGTNGIQTIKPSGASSVTLNFSNFDFEPGYDYLYIYDGESIFSPLIGAFTGYDLPNGGIISSSGSAITLKQASDQILNYSGFICNWSCTLPTSVPIAKFEANVTSTCDGKVSFYDKSTEGPTSWQWVFGDGSTSTAQNPSHTYSSSGYYTVKLKACNTFGCSVQEIKTNYITVSKPCTVIKMGTTSSNFTTLCSGILKDNGGDANYTNYTNSAITITPIGASKVILNFSSFSFEDGYDYLAIYDGDDINADPIGFFTGYDLPGGGIISSSGGSITLEQYSDESYTDAGFKLTWSCEVVSTEDALLNASSLNVYPNPSQGEINVEYSFEGSQELTGILYNALGQVVYRFSGTYQNSMSEKIVSGNITKGIYYLSISNAQGQSSSKQIIVE